MSEKRFINAAEIDQWESHTLNGLAAIEKQVSKTLKNADSEMNAMKSALKRATEAMAREREQQAKRVDHEIDIGLEENQLSNGTGVPSADELAAMSPTSAMIVLKGGTPPIKEEAAMLPTLKRANGYAEQGTLPRGGLRCLQQAMEFSKDEASKEEISVESTTTPTSERVLTPDTHRSNASRRKRTEDSTAAEAESQLQAILHDAQLDAQLQVERVKGALGNTSSGLPPRPGKMTDTQKDLNASAPLPLGVDLRASRKLNKKTSSQKTLK